MASTARRTLGANEGPINPNTMPIVKRLKFDLDGTGEITLVPIKVNTAGVFSADLPMLVKSATHRVVSDVATLAEALEQVNSIITAYQALQRTEQQVILIHFRREPVPFLNEGIGLSLNYVVANKHVFGKQISYRIMRLLPDGTWEEMVNSVPTHRWKGPVNEGVVGGESLELGFTPERYQTLTDLNERLNALAGKLEQFCSTETGFLQLVTSTSLLVAEAPSPNRP